MQVQVTRGAGSTPSEFLGEQAELLGSRAQRCVAPHFVLSTYHHHSGVIAHAAGVLSQI